MRGSSLNTADYGRRRSVQWPNRYGNCSRSPISAIPTSLAISAGWFKSRSVPRQVPISASVFRAYPPHGRTREFAAARPVERSGKELEYV